MSSPSLEACKLTWGSVGRCQVQGSCSRHAGIPCALLFALYALSFEDCLGPWAECSRWALRRWEPWNLGPSLQPWGESWALWVLFLLLPRAGWETSVQSHPPRLTSLSVKQHLRAMEVQFL